MTRVDELLAEWREGAAERERLMRKTRDHGVNSKAREKLLARDSKIGRRLHDIHDELREFGVDPLAR